MLSTDKVKSKRYRLLVVPPPLHPHSTYYAEATEYSSTPRAGADFAADAKIGAAGKDVKIHFVCYELDGSPCTFEAGFFVRHSAPENFHSNPASFEVGWDQIKKFFVEAPNKDLFPNLSPKDRLFKLRGVHKKNCKRQDD